MKFIERFFNFDYPCSRLEFNLIFLLFIGLCWVSCRIYIAFWDRSGAETATVIAFILFSFAGFLLVSAMFRRLKNLNKTNKFIIETFFKGFLFIWAGCMLYLFFSEIIGNMVTSCSYYIHDLLRINLYVFLILGGLFLLYLLVLCMFFKGAEREIFICRKICFRKFFTGKIWTDRRDFKGCAGRYDFFVYGFIYMVLAVFPIFVLLLNIRSDSLFFWLTYIVFALYLIFTLSLFVRRIRSVGLKPWHYIMVFVPVMNMILVSLLMFGEKTE